jgi:hypothetical protein
MSAELAIGSVGDNGVRDGEDAVDRPEKLSSGSSEVVWVAMCELSIAVAMICMVLNPSSEKTDVRHSSLIGRGVIDPAMSS